MREPLVRKKGAKAEDGYARTCVPHDRKGPGVGTDEPGEMLLDGWELDTQAFGHDAKSSVGYHFRKPLKEYHEDRKPMFDLAASRTAKAVMAEAARSEGQSVSADGIYATEELLRADQ